MTDEKEQQYKDCLAKAHELTDLLGRLWSDQIYVPQSKQMQKICTDFRKLEEKP